MVLALLVVSALHRFYDGKVWSEAVVSGLLTTLISIGLIIGIRYLNFMPGLNNLILTFAVFAVSAFLLNLSRRYSSRDKKFFPFIVGGSVAALALISIKFNVTAFLGVAIN